MFLPILKIWFDLTFSSWVLSYWVSPANCLHHHHHLWEYTGLLYDLEYHNNLSRVEITCFFIPGQGLLTRLFSFFCQNKSYILFWIMCYPKEMPCDLSLSSLLPLNQVYQLFLEWAKVDKWLLANRDLDHPFLLCECWWCVSLDN